MELAGDVLKRILATSEGPPGSSVFGAWAAVAGTQLAAHTRVVDLEGDRLVVEADHPGWGQMVQMRQKQILAHLRKRYPQLTLSRVLMRYAGNDRSRSAEAPHPPGVRDTATPDPEIKDERLAAALERLRGQVERVDTADHS